MSVSLLNPTHIATVAALIVRHEVVTSNVGGSKVATRRDIAEALAEMNVESLVNRYGEDATRDEIVGYIDECVGMSPLVDVGLAEGYRYLQCYRYQTSEAVTFKGSDVEAWTEATKARIADKMAGVLLNGRFAWEATPDPRRKVA